MHVSVNKLILKGESYVLQSEKIFTQRDVSYRIRIEFRRSIRFQNERFRKASKGHPASASVDWW